MMASGQCALVKSWDEFFPGLDADDSKVKGLWVPAKPLVGKPLRAKADVGFGEIPGYRPPGRLGAWPVQVLEEPRRGLAVHAVGMLEGRDDALHPAGWLRADAPLLVRRSAREGQGRCRPGHHAPSRNGEVDHRQQHRVGTRHAAVGWLLEQRDPGQPRQAVDGPGLRRRCQEVHGHRCRPDRQRKWPMRVCSNPQEGGRQLRAASLFYHA